MSVFLFIPIFLDLFSSPISAVDVGNWLLLGGLTLKIFILKGAKKKEEDLKMAAKANKIEVKEEFTEVKESIDKKLDEKVFNAHQKDNEKQHKDIIYVRTQVDEIKTILIKQAK